MIWYVIFYFNRRVVRLNELRITIFLLSSLVLLLILPEIMAEQAFSFFIGIMISEKKDKAESLLSLKLGIITICISIIFLGIKQLSIIRNSPEIIIKLVQLFIKLPSSVGILAIVYRSKIKSAIIDFVGRISYELYLIHGYVLGYVPINCFGVIIFLTVSFVLSYVYMYLLKKIEPFEKQIMGMVDVDS